MSHQDVVFYRNFAIVLAVISIAGIAFYMMAQVVSGPTESQSAEATRRAEAITETRIQPVGQIRLAGTEEEEPIAAPPSEVVAAPAEAESGESAEPDATRGQTVYSTACVACHGMGVAGAPKLGDKSAWEARLSKGLEGLATSAIGGFQGANGYMPPRGGNASLSDADVRNAVAYMLSEVE